MLISAQRVSTICQHFDMRYKLWIWTMLTFAIALAAYIYIAHDYFQNSRQMLMAFSKSCPVAKRKTNRKRPQCMAAWVREPYRIDIENSLKCTDFALANSVALKYKIDMHFPHFSTQYFSFFSYSVSESDSNHIAVTSEHNSGCTSFINHLIVDDKLSKAFWLSTKDEGKGIIDIVKAVDRNWETRSIISSSCVQKHPEMFHLAPEKIDLGWFRHPADSLLLGSLILGEDPCSYQGIGERLLSPMESVSMTILNRKTDRQILNPNDIEYWVNEFNELEFSQRAEGGAHVKAKIIILAGNASKDINMENSILNNSTTYTLFEEMEFRDQAQLMRSTDILVTVHGAGETNMAWMKPCSVVLEVFPWAFYYDYFGSLAARSDVLLYQWQEPRERTAHTKLLKKHLQCARQFEIAMNTVGTAAEQLVEKADKGILDPPVLLRRPLTKRSTQAHPLSENTTMYKHRHHRHHHRHHFRSLDAATAFDQDTGEAADQGQKYETRIYRAHEKYTPNASTPVAFHAALAAARARNARAAFAEAEAVTSLVCSSLPRCRSCSRGADGIYVSRSQFLAVLKVALADRRQCIKNHPFLSPSKH